MGLIIPGIILTGCMRQNISTEEVDKMIKDQVPIGSDKQQVKAFIDTFQIGNLKIIRDKEFHEASLEPLGSEVGEEVAALGSRVAEYTGAVILSAYRHDFMTYDDIIITFYLDKDGRTIDHTVKTRGAN